MTDFVYWNENPQNDIKGDCVCRAITFASGLPYEKIQEKLYFTGKLLECDPLCVTCYDFLLTKYFKYTPIFCENEPLEDFASKHPIGLYLVRSRGHISVLEDNKVYDTWDCRDMVLTKAWRIA